MKKIGFMFSVLLAALPLASCSEDEPARMEWKVSASPEDNFDISASPLFYPSVLINALPGEGTVTVTCTNFSKIAMENPAFTSVGCGFTVEQTAPNELTFTFAGYDADEMRTEMIFVSARDGKGESLAAIGVNRAKEFNYE